MYVKKFEAETLDEALRSVKGELGPDAIILKTITNKGLKGAFKKGRVEITAAISEESYSKKSNVDRALGEHKESFYQAPSSSINHMINEYNDHAPASSNSSRPNGVGGYGNIGLNKVVNTVSKASSKFKSSLDDFLTTEEEEPQSSSMSMQDYLDEEEEEIIPQQRVVEAAERISSSEVRVEESGPNEYERRLKAQLDSQRKQIEILEQKLFELSKNSIGSHNSKDEENPAMIDLKESLRTLDLNESIVSTILKKARFELNETEQRDEEQLFDLALRELASMINTELPMFSTTQEDDIPVVTALISESSSGQTSMAMKLAVLMEDVKVIRLRTDKQPVENEFAQKVFNLDISNVETLSHLMSEARKAIEDKRQILLDIKVNAGKEDESKKILDTLKRSFKKLEVLANISAIHSELYNRKILSKYKEKLNGVIISNVDQCLNYGALVNTHYKFNNLPLKFFGTGPTVPDDIEGATAERILAGMFNL